MSLFECGHGGVGFSDCAAQRAGSRMGDRPPGQYRVERVAQIELGGLQARLPEILHLIVDAPQIQHRAIGGEHHGFRRHRGAGVTGQNLPRVEQSGKAVSVFARVPPDFFVGNRGIALHRKEEHATRGVRLFDAVHLRRVAVAQGAIRGDEEEHYGARLGPLILVVLDALRIAQGKLERGSDSPFTWYWSITHSSADPEPRGYSNTSAGMPASVSDSFTRSDCRSALSFIFVTRSEYGPRLSSMN